MKTLFERNMEQPELIDVYTAQDRDFYDVRDEWDQVDPHYKYAVRYDVLDWELFPHSNPNTLLYYVKYNGGEGCIEVFKSVFITNVTFYPDWSPVTRSFNASNSSMMASAVFDVLDGVDRSYITHLMEEINNNRHINIPEDMAQDMKERISEMFGF